MKKKMLTIASLLLLGTMFITDVSYAFDQLALRVPERCSWYDRGTHFLVKDTCFRQGLLPTLSLQEAGDSLLAVVEDVTDTYGIDESAFSYDGTDLLVSPGFAVMIDQWNDGSWFERNTDGSGFTIVPKSLLAWLQAQDWTFYASMRDTSTYGACRLTNYSIAMHSLDGYVLEPGALLNMNKHISFLPGYCYGEESPNQRFYQGVCGGSTQLFWNGLINPHVEVTKRANHGQWYAGFYGSAIMGDDASLYGMAKQLEIKNTSDKPVYFGTVTRKSDKNIVLVSIFPGKSDRSTYIQKQQMGPLQSVVVRTVVDQEGTLIDQQERNSYYWGVNNDTDTAVDTNPIDL